MDARRKAYEAYLAEYDWASTLGRADGNIEKRMTFKEFCADEATFDTWMELTQNSE